MQLDICYGLIKTMLERDQDHELQEVHDEKRHARQPLIDAAIVWRR
jgi:hypothetical protein